MMKHCIIRAPAAIAAVGAILLIAASAALGTAYAYTLGAHFGPWVAYAFAAKRAFSAGRQGFWRRAACLAVATVAIVYSLTAELGFSAGARGDLAAGRAAEIKAAHSADAAAKRAGDELARLKPARPVTEIEALVEGAKPQCRIVVGHGYRDTVCSKPAALVAELGRAKRRAELEAAIAAAGKVNAGVGEADPQAAAVVAYLAAAGFEVDAKRVATWLHLLPVLLLEIGSAFGLLVAGGLERQASPARVPAKVPAIDAAPPAGVPGPERLPANVVLLTGRRRPPARVPATVRHPVIAALERAGKPMSVSELAAAMGVSAGEASKRWQEVDDRLLVGWSGRRRSIALRRPSSAGR